MRRPFSGGPSGAAGEDVIMGQKVRPTGFRTGIMRPWRSTWYASKQDYAELLLEDNTIRKFIADYLTDKKDRKQQRPAIADIKIERTRERVTIVVTSSRVGAIIGIKVWVNQGDYLTGEIADATDANATPIQRRRGPRRSGGGGGGGQRQG